MLFALPALGQDWITVAELNLELGANSEETVYYGFETGDVLRVSMEVLQGKTIRAFELSEYPDNSRLLEYETAKVEKSLNVYERGIYSFRLKNSALMKKSVCRLKIERLPASPAAAAFNPAVRWVERLDTTYEVQSETLVQKDEAKEVQQRRRVLAKVDTSVTTILEKVERVHSWSRLGTSNVSYIAFELPKNRYEPNAQEPYSATEVVSWAYWIGIGEESEKVFNDANAQIASRIAKGLTSGAIRAGFISSGYGALAMLAIEGVSFFSNPPAGDNVLYEVLKGKEGEYQLLSKGNSVTGFGRIDSATQGPFAFRLENDNYVEAINVNIKVIAILETKTYRDEYFSETQQTPFSEHTVVRKPVITRVRVPVLAKPGEGF